MTMYTVPVQVSVPAHGVVEVESDSLEGACISVQEDINVRGFYSIAGEVELEADWGNITDLTVPDVVLPDGRKFSARS